MKTQKETALITNFIKAYSDYVFENALSDNSKIGPDYEQWLADKLTPLLKEYSDQQNKELKEAFEGSKGTASKTSTDYLHAH